MKKNVNGVSFSKHLLLQRNISYILRNVSLLNYSNIYIFLKRCAVSCSSGINTSNRRRQQNTLARCDFVRFNSNSFESFTYNMRELKRILCYSNRKSHEYVHFPPKKNKLSFLVFIYSICYVEDFNIIFFSKERLNQPELKLRYEYEGHG